MNQACVDEIGNIRKSEQPHHAEPATCSSTSNFNEDEDLNVKYVYMDTCFFLNFTLCIHMLKNELNSRTSSQNSVAESYDSDKENNLGKNNSSNAFEVSRPQ